MLLVELGGIMYDRRGIWKLRRNIVVEAVIDGSNGSFYSHRPWKLPCISLLPQNSMEVNVLPPAPMGIPW